MGLILILIKRKAVKSGNVFFFNAYRARRVCVLKNFYFCLRGWMFFRRKKKNKRNARVKHAMTKKRWNQVTSLIPELIRPPYFFEYENHRGQIRGQKIIFLKLFPSVFFSFFSPNIFPIIFQLKYLGNLFLTKFPRKKKIGKTFSLVYPHLFLSTKFTEGGGGLARELR